MMVLLAPGASVPILLVHVVAATAPLAQLHVPVELAVKNVVLAGTVVETITLVLVTVLLLV